MTIAVLPDSVVAQIAAGEVVERPASVVKELVENALDAGATSIHVTVESGGRRLIRVLDNGSGIPANEVELAFTRHATSKLRTADDLVGVRTLGFRGEALASIASVSHVSVVTRHQNEQSGVQLTLEAGVPVQRRAVGAPVGTAVTVEHLFFNTPARLKFLKSESTEKRHIDLVVSRYAMAYPHVRFVLDQDGREAFRSSGSGDLAEVLVAALGLEIFSDMIAVDGEYRAPSSPPVSVRGFTSGLGTHRADRSRITLFVNRRWVQDSGLTYAVTQAYHTLLTRGRYPIAVLMISVEPSDVDVNVHPAKAEVRFRDQNTVFSAVQRLVRRAVVDHGAVPQIHRTNTDPALSSGLIDPDRVRQKSLLLGFESPGQFTQHAESASRVHSTPPSAQEAPARPRTLPMLRVVGQVGASYIVAEGPVGVYMIDQHAAHERILYEQLMEERVRGATTVQLTLAAQTIALPASEARLVEENLDRLSELGFQVEPFGPNVFLIRGIPALLADSDPVETFLSVVEELEAGAVPGASSIEERIVRQVCRLAAVKAGTVLSMEEMQSLVRQLERCQAPLTCPHGRPTLIHLSSEQLAREFQRR
ncbi:MAG: DNA mismatch repair endonuclease MutL [Aggregatilineales bacterium]